MHSIGKEERKKKSLALLSVSILGYRPRLKQLLPWPEWPSLWSLKVRPNACPIDLEQTLRKSQPLRQLNSHSSETG